MPASTDAQLPQQPTALTLRGAEKIFAGGVRAVAPIDLTVSAGQFVALLGPSGCGKSTLLRLIAGLETPSSGVIEWTDGKPPRLAYVFQDAHLLPWRTAVANVALPLELAGVDKAERQARAMLALASVGLADAGGRYPAALSGGMRMRVSLARALVTRPSVLLLDEPFAALDELTRQQLDDLLRQRFLTDGLTVLFVTHSVAEAVYLADRAIVLSPRPAGIVYDAAVDLPRDRRDDLRTTPHFAAALRPVHAALAKGGA